MRIWGEKQLAEEILYRVATLQSLSDSLTFPWLFQIFRVNIYGVSTLTTVAIQHPWHFPDMFQIPWHFQVFQTSGHHAYKRAVIWQRKDRKKDERNHVRISAILRVLTCLMQPWQDWTRETEQRDQPAGLNSQRPLQTCAPDVLHTQSNHLNMYSK